MRFEPEDIEALRPLLREVAAELLAAAPPRLPDSRMAYTEAEAAALLGLKTHVLREQRRLGRIEPCKAMPGRRVLYTPQAIARFLAGGADSVN